MSLGEFTGSGSGITKGLWHLNGNSNDNSGNGNNGTDTNITYGLAYGKFGQGADFNGSTSKITIASNLGINGGNITISAWIKRKASIGSNGTCFIQGNNTSKVGYAIRENGGGKLWLSRSKQGVAEQSVDMGSWTTALSDSVFTMITLTYDGTDIKGYSNGTLVGTTAASGNGTSAITDGSNIGSYFGSYFANVSIDEVIVENVAWSAEKVKKYYTYSRGFYSTI